MLRGFTSKSIKSNLNWESAVQERYKFLGFLSVSITSLQGVAKRPRLVITTFWNLLAPFHGGNTGSNPVGDAKYYQELRRKTRSRRDTKKIHSVRPDHTHHLALRSPLVRAKSLGIGVERHRRRRVTQQLLHSFDIFTVSLRIEENVWRNVCHEIFLVIPSFRAMGWMRHRITVLSHTGCFPRFAPARSPLPGLLVPLL